MFERIVVPLDGSETAAEALAAARTLARQFGGTLHLVRAVHTLGDLASVATPTLERAEFSQDVIARGRSGTEQADAREYLEALRLDLAADGIRAETRVRAGAPAEQILEAARAASADLIVMTAYGAGGAHTRAGGAVFGGVADEVLRESRTPVLLNRP